MSATKEKVEKTNDKVTEAVEKAGKTIESTLDKLVDSQTRLLEAAETARDRSRRLSDEYLKSVADAQRDVIELTKTIASQPTEMGKNMEAVLESATAAQARAMEITKNFYREQAEATSELQRLVSPLFQPTEGFADLTKNFRSFMQKGA